MFAPPLLPGEQVLLRKGVNYLVRLGDHGLAPLGGLQRAALRGVGLPDDHEGMGGWLHLTTYRLVFVAHPANRVAGRTSLFLPVVDRAAPWSHRWARGLEVTVGDRAHRFVLRGGLDEWCARVTAAAQAAQGAHALHIWDVAAAHPDVAGDTATRSLFGAALLESSDVLQGLTNPFSLATGAAAAVFALKVAALREEHRGRG